MIETERLVLRQWREEDREPWRALNADPQVMRHFPETLAPDASDRFMAYNIAFIAEHGAGMWAAERKADGAFLGFIGLNRIAHDIPLKGQWELGWRLAAHSWGHGYATEGAIAARDHGLRAMALDRLVAYTASSNLPSMAVMRRIGMAPAPAEDFDHPAIAEGHPLSRHVVWEIRR